MKTKHADILSKALHIKPAELLPCPTHKTHKNSVSTARHEGMLGKHVFRCTRPECTFHGTIVDYIEAYNNVSTDKAVHLITKNPELHGEYFNEELDVLVTSTGIRFTTEEYNELSAYMAKCMTSGRAGAKVVGSLTKNGIGQDSIKDEYVGGLVKQLPDSLLGDLSKIVAGKLDNILVFFYTCGGKISKLVVHDTVQKQTRAEVKVDPYSDSHGIFRENKLDWPEVPRVVIASNEIEALKAVAKLQQHTLRNPNIVACSTAADLKYLKGLREVSFLSSPAAPLTMQRALNFWESMPETSITVIKLPFDINKLEGVKLSKQIKKGTPVCDWIVAELKSISSIKGIKEASRVANSIVMSRRQRSTILDAMVESKCDNDLIAAVKNSLGTYTATKIGNKEYRRTEGGYRAITASKGGSLSNFCFNVTGYSDLADGSLLMEGILVFGDRKTEQKELRLETKRLMTNSGAKLATYLWECCLRAGVDYKFEAAKLHDTDWYTLLRSFDKATYKGQTRSLGYDGEYLTLPNLRIDTKIGKIIESKVGTINKACNSYYGGLNLDPKPSLENLVKVYKSEHKRDQIFTTILNHVLGELVSPVLTGVLGKPKHLAIPYAMHESPMRSIVADLNYLLAGSFNLKRYTRQAPMKDNEIEDLKALGSLPRVIGTKYAVAIEDALYQLGMGHVILVPSKEAAKLNRVTSMSFLESYDDLFGPTDTELTPKVLRGCGGEIAVLLRDIVVGVNSGDLQIDSSLELSGNIGNWIESLLNVTYSAPSMVHSTYTMAEYNTFNDLISILFTERASGKFRLAASSYAFRTAEKGTYQGYCTKDSVVLTLGILPVIESVSPYFSVANITLALEENGCHKKNSKFVIPVAIWSSYEKRANPDMLRVDPSSGFSLQEAAS